MSERNASEKPVFTYAEAAALVTEVLELTEHAYRKVEALSKGGERRGEAEAVVEEWAHAMQSRGIEVKGLWLLDFDNGSGYYCWRYPEAALMYYHGYDEGFRGRVPIQ
jgi:hypothetical protein